MMLHTITLFLALAHSTRVTHAFAVPKVQRGAYINSNPVPHRKKTTLLSDTLPVIAVVEKEPRKDVVPAPLDVGAVGEDPILNSVLKEEELVQTRLNEIALSGVPKELDVAATVASLETAEPLSTLEGTEVPNLDAVSAILAASEEATVAAEASLLSDDVKETLNFLDTSGDQDTLFPSSESETATADIVPVSTVVGEPLITTNPEPIVAPSVAKILQFAVPAIGVWLCGPLLSLIDTSTVGIFSGTVQQAALNPAVAVTDYAALLVAFLFTATTNMVASAQESDKNLPDKPKTTQALVGAMQLSSYVGIGLGAILFIFAAPLLRAIIGNDGISPAVFSAALKYVRIRALGMPAAAVIGSAQAACLGMQDIRSPLYVLAAAAVVNFFGDMLFVRNAHPLIGGAAGAAWATVFSQFAALSLFVRWLCRKPEAQRQPSKVVNLSKAIMELTGKPTSENQSRRRQFREALRSFRLPTSKRGKPAFQGSGRLSMIMGRLRRKSSTAKKEEPTKPKETPFSVRGFLHGRFRGRDLAKPPSKQVTEEFAPYVLPVTTTQVGRVSGYIAMSHVVSSSLGTVSMAAQQVIVSLFYCLCPIADSLSLTAQSFIPSIAEKRISKERSGALKEASKNFAKAGGVFGAAMVGAVAFIPFLSRFFTTDPAVVALVNSVSPLLLGFFGVHGVMCAAEGLLLGQKDLSFLGRMYAAYFAVVPLIMLRVKRAALTGVPGVNLSSVWKVFLGYQLFRFAAWVGRVGFLQRKADVQAASLEA